MNKNWKYFYNKSYLYNIMLYKYTSIKEGYYKDLHLFDNMKWKYMDNGDDTAVNGSQNHIKDIYINSTEAFMIINGIHDEQ